MADLLLKAGLASSLAQVAQAALAYLNQAVRSLRMGTMQSHSGQSLVPIPTQPQPHIQWEFLLLRLVVAAS